MRSIVRGKLSFLLMVKEFIVEWYIFTYTARRWCDHMEILEDKEIT